MVVMTARGHRSGPLLSRGKMDGLFMKEFVFVCVCVCIVHMSRMLLIMWF